MSENIDTRKDAIVAVCDDGEVVMVSLLTDVHSIVEIVDLDGGIDDMYVELSVGIYFAHCEYAHSSDGTQIGEWYTSYKWIVDNPIYIMPPDRVENLKRAAREA